MANCQRDETWCDEEIATLRAELEEALGLLGRARQWLPVVGDGACQPPEIEPLCDEIDALYDSAKGSLWWEAEQRYAESRGEW